MTVPMHAAADKRRSGGRAAPRRQPLSSVGSGARATERARWGFPTGAAAAARNGARAPEAGRCTTRAGDGGGGREVGSPRCAAGSKLTYRF